MPLTRAALQRFVALVALCILSVPALAQSRRVVDHLETLGARVTQVRSGVVTKVRFLKPDIVVSNDDLRLLSALTGLERVHLLQTYVTDEGLRHLRPIANLKQLVLPPTITNEGVAEIRAHKGLESLELTGPGVTDVGAAHFAEFRKLKSLHLFGTAISDFGMPQVAACSALEVLGAPRRISDEGLRLVTKLTRLVALDLSGTRVTDQGLSHLETLRRLDWLSLAGTSVSNDGLRFLEPLTELGFLDLTRTNINDDGMAHLTSLQKLDVLCLPEEVTDAGMQEIGKLKRLRTLYASHTRITDAGLQALVVGKVPLRTLSLYHTNVTDEGISYLTRIRTLEDVNLGETRVTHDGILRLQRALPNTTIQWPR